jgi:molybdopterin-containing oxidoreductase family membrane subunit
LIVVPTLSHKYLPYSWGHYQPRPVELIITAATFCAMGLLYTLFAKFVPIISIWELKVGEHPKSKVPAPVREEEATAAGELL